MGRHKNRTGFYFLLIMLLGVGAYLAYRHFYGAVSLGGKAYIHFYVESDDKLDDVAGKLEAIGIVKERAAFDLLARTFRLEENIYPGKYRINAGMSVRQIVKMLRNNRQEKVRLNYNSQIHTMEKFLEYSDEKLEISADDLEDALEDGEWLTEKFGLQPECRFAAIVPGTYEVGWSISAKDLLEMLHRKYKQVWTPARIARATRLGLSAGEVITLASIVQSESTIRSEQEKIAGVYINRLRRDMPLQADPTLRFANNAFDVQRFWNSDKKVNSPYNTYKYKGLPPGPICLVYPQCIDATLNFVKHKYMYFCAKPSLDGYSDFAETYTEHEKNADAYQRSLDKRGINR